MLSETFFVIMLLSFIPLGAAIIFALIGIFQKGDSNSKASYFAISAKAVLVFTVMLMVGSGGCLVSM